MPKVDKPISYPEPEVMELAETSDLLERRLWRPRSKATFRSAMALPTTPGAFAPW
jgi:hypothetical protein